MATSATNPFEDLNAAATDAIRYWEPRRLAYNAVLAAVVALHFVIALPKAWAVLSADLGLSLFVLAVVANVLYCAAYVPDVFAQISSVRATWMRHRWVLFAVGTAFASTLARFVSMGLFSHGRC